MCRDLKMFLKYAIKPHKILKVAIDFVRISLNPLNLSVYTIDILQDAKFWGYIDNEIKRAQQSFPDPRLGGWMLDFPALMIYPIVRTVKPEVVVETGVGPGGSSALILNALSKNNKGHLYSIDLPGADSIIYPKIGRCYNIHVPPSYEVGWLIPSWLRNRWTLQLSDSKEKLPDLLSNLNSVDVFLHDSLHTDEHVFFELNAILPKLRKGGLLMADDVNEYWSLAFVDFCKIHSLPYFVLGNRLGIAIKV